MPESGHTAIGELKAFLKHEIARPVRSPAAFDAHLKLRQLEVFREAAHHETFAETARALHVTRAAVSDAIGQLEHDLGGVRLFDRDEAGGSLTATGKAFLDKAEKLLADEATAHAAVGGARPQVRTAHRGVRGPERHIKLRQVEVFLEPARHESLATTARTLGVSAAYMSEAISALERDLGEDVRLFERDGGGTRLTPAGRALAAQGWQLLIDEDAARAAVAASGSIDAKGIQAPVSARHHRNAEDVLAAIEFIEHRAPPGNDLRFPEVLGRELQKTLPEMGGTGETVERMALLLDLIQASVTQAEDLPAMLAPDGRASEAFRARHELSEQQHAEDARGVARRRGPRQR